MTAATGKGVARRAKSPYRSVPMKRITLLLTVISIFAGLQIVAAAGDQFVYPQAPKGSQADNYFGTKVADPYRDLDNADAHAIGKWIDADDYPTFGHSAC